MDTDELHIYGQGAWHDDVVIIGNAKTLRKLSEILRIAASCDASGDMFFCSDGEGFKVRILNRETLDDQPLPYYDNMALDSRSLEIH